MAIIIVLSHIHYKCKNVRQMIRVCHFLLLMLCYYLPVYYVHRNY